MFNIIIEHFRFFGDRHGCARNEEVKIMTNDDYYGIIAFTFTMISECTNTPKKMV